MPTSMIAWVNSGANCLWVLVCQTTVESLETGLYVSCGAVHIAWNELVLSFDFVTCALVTQEYLATFEHRKSPASIDLAGLLKVCNYSPFK